MICNEIEKKGEKTLCLGKKKKYLRGWQFPQLYYVGRVDVLNLWR